MSINGHDGLYATCGTSDKFWAKWKEQAIAESSFVRFKNTPLAPNKLDLLFNHRPAKVRDEYLSLIAGGDLVVTDQDRLLVSLLRHDRPSGVFLKRTKELSAIACSFHFAQNLSLVPQVAYKPS
jgi:type I restriction enzyme R subunit